MRSTDDGTTLSTFRTFQRDAAAYPTAAVRHGHAVQWDPVGQRMYFACCDGEQAAGLCRVTGDGSTIEPVFIRSQLPSGLSAGAVGVMFVPDYIAWGNDQFANSGTFRMARSEIGQPAPEIELVAILQASSFYVARTRADNSEWLLTVSNENGAGGRLDNAMHIYRVADDAATVDEVPTLPINADDAAFDWLYPMGGTVLGDGPIWWGTSATSLIQPFTNASRGYQFRGRRAWGGQSLVRPDATVRRPHYQPAHVSSGYVSLAGGQSQAVRSLRGPPRATRLYILESSREQSVGSGFH